MFDFWKMTIVLQEITKPFTSILHKITFSTTFFIVHFQSCSGMETNFHQKIAFHFQLFLRRIPNEILFCTIFLCTKKSKVVERNILRWKIKGMKIAYFTAVTWLFPQFIEPTPHNNFDNNNYPIFFYLRIYGL